MKYSNVFRAPFPANRMEDTGEKVLVEKSSVIRVSEDDLARQPFNVMEGSDRDHRGSECNGHKSSKRSRSRSCSSNRWVAKKRRANAFFPRAKNPNNGGEGVAVLPRIPPAFPSDVSILEVSMISTRRFNSDCPATVHYFMALWAKELLVEDGFPMLQEEF